MRICCVVPLDQKIPRRGSDSLTSQRVIDALLPAAEIPSCSTKTTTRIKRDTKRADSVTVENSKTSWPGDKTEEVLVHLLLLLS